MPILEIPLLLLAGCGGVDSGGGIVRLPTETSSTTAPTDPQTVGGSEHEPPTPQVETLRSWGADLVEPTRLATDERGTVYITDPRAGQVVVRAPDGSVAQRVMLGGAPLGIAVEAAGTVLVGDAAASLVKRFDADWNEIGVLGAVQRPSDIGIHRPTGNVYVVDSDADNVKIFAPSGEPLGVFDGGTHADTALVFPTGLAIDGAHVWVASQLNRRVVRFDLAGTPLASFGRHGEELGEIYAPAGLWVDDEKRVWVVDGRVGRVSAFSPSGRYLGHVGRFGSGPGQLRLPGDVVVDAAGRLLVTSANDGRVVLFGLDGSSDPDRVAVASVTLEPSIWVRGQPPAEIRAVITVEGHAATRITASSVTANGVPAVGSAVADHDGDGALDLGAMFGGPELLATVAVDGPTQVLVAGSIDGLAFEAAAVADVSPATAVAAMAGSRVPPPAVAAPSGERRPRVAGPGSPRIEERADAAHRPAGRTPTATATAAASDTDGTGDTEGTGDSAAAVRGARDAAAAPEGCRHVPGTSSAVLLLGLLALRRRRQP